MACSAQHAMHGRAMVFAVLGFANKDDPSLVTAGLRSCRALRLRNPRAGFHAGASYEDVLASLHGVPAENSSHADGSFWIEFPIHFMSHF
mmetsp:Transcript_121469/g.241947  ORF Transcript_121469/g.241947 Transcript_121469/m.241947 type:complete len:90 (-) Transcript_121469:2-271(-)